MIILRVEFRKIVGDAYTFTNLKNIDFNRKNIIQHPLQLDIQI
jgi:hypothetical protein